MNDWLDKGLTPEEQRLAAILQTDAPKRKSNPALDAAILSAAREAVKPAVKPSRRRTWAPLTGLAATVALSGFLLLRYNAVDQMPNVPSAAESPVAASDAAAVTVAESTAVESDAIEDSSNVVAGNVNRIREPMAVAKEPVEKAAIPPYAIAPQRTEDKVYADRAANMSVATAPAPAPPPPAAPPAPVVVEATPAEASDRGMLDRYTGASESKVQMRTERTAVGRVSVRGAVIGDFPVSDDTKLDRDAWIERIEHRLARGDRIRAKESLTAFLRRYPDAELPEALENLR